MITIGVDEDWLDPAYLRNELRSEGEDARVTAEWRDWYLMRCQDEAARGIGW
jgi:hypothetical protein